MTAEVPAYDRLQAEVADATRSVAARRILDLGVGTGVTSARVLLHHPGAEVVGVDASEGMLALARAALPHADLRCGRLEDALPDGPFDVVVSALAVHHLTAEHKADLFARVGAELGGRGVFVLADVIVPDDPALATTPLHPDHDRPERLDDLAAWLHASGFATSVTWRRGDLAVVAARPAG